MRRIHRNYDRQQEGRVDDLAFLVTIMLLEDSSAVLSLGFSCQEMGYSYAWKRRVSPFLMKDGKVIRCKSENRVSIVACCQETRKPDDTSTTSGDRLQIPGARSSGGLAREADLLSQLGARDQTQASQLAGTMFFTHFPRDPASGVCKLTKMPELRAGTGRKR